MTTAFLIIFSLLIEYIYDPISNMKDTHVMQSLIEKYKEYFKDYFNNKYALYLFFAVLVFVLINIILLLVDLILHPFFSFLINLIILVYCLRPGEFNRIIDEVKLLGDVEKSKNFEIKRTNYILAYNLSSSVNDNRSIIFYSSTRNIFNVLFWFLILGPAGALSYISIDFMVNGSMKIDTQSKKKLKQFIGIIEFIPIHLTLLSFALVDDFETCKKHWQSISKKKDLYLSNIDLITTIGLNLVIRNDDLNNNDFFYTNAQMIIFRALLAWLSIIVLLIFGGFFI
ncbi:MAG: hypothetical protein CM15mP69_6170 [Ectothiorhodospiraceae bacterium]|nr:MAG: hypothetical protein CM15mP69_6170 [Ectothiorhodospiraceae bacterium]